MAAKIRRGDRVIVLTGRDRGQIGEVLRMIPGKAQAVVNGVNVAKRHRKPTQQDPGGIDEIELPIHCSNLALLDPRDNVPTRVGFRFLEDGRKVRFARVSGEIIDT